MDEAEDFGLLHKLGAKDKEMAKQGDPPVSQLNLSGRDVGDNSFRVLTLYLVSSISLCYEISTELLTFIAYCYDITTYRLISIAS